MRFLLPAAMLITCTQPALAQPATAPPRLELEDIAAQVRRDGRVELERLGVVIERDDFAHDGGLVETVIVRPTRPGAGAALLLIPGHSRTAYDMLPQAIRFARAGFASLSVSQPGYGGSAGPADFAGPRTFAALRAAAERFVRQPYVEPARFGVYGYSRGALAAAQLAARTDLFRAAVLGGGVYDFRAAYDQVTLPGIRANMAAETGLTDEAIRFRSPLHDMAGLDGPVLIIHGAQDANAPPAQARALADKLLALGRQHQLVMVPAGTHALGMNDVVVPALQFFARHLGPPGATTP